MKIEADADAGAKYIVGVGACYIDTILTVSNYPDEDSKLRATQIVRRRGGNSPNALQVLQQLLAHSAPAAAISSPDAGAPAQLTPLLVCVLPARGSAAAESIAASLPGVGMQHCVFRDATEPASSYVVRSLATDSRTIVNWNDLPEMRVAEFAAVADGLGHDVALYHFEGRIPRVTLACIRHLRSRFPAAKISVEVEKPDRDGLVELAAEADYVFYSKSWAQARGYANPEACLRAQARATPKASLLCCTWGEDGAGALALPRNEFEHIPAFKHNGHTVVDTLGAGDTFIAGMLFAVAQRGKSWSLARMLRFANELAGRKVVQEGFEGLGEQMKLQMQVNVHGHVQPGEPRP